MTTGKNVTGVRDEHYNLVSILYHAYRVLKHITHTSAMQRVLVTKSLLNSSVKDKKRSADGPRGLRNCWGESSLSNNSSVTYTA
jgi:hypothetical protein